MTSGRLVVVSRFPSLTTLTLSSSSTPLLLALPFLLLHPIDTRQLHRQRRLWVGMARYQPRHCNNRRCQTDQPLGHSFIRTGQYHGTRPTCLPGATKKRRALLYPCHSPRSSVLLSMFVQQIEIDLLQNLNASCVYLLCILARVSLPPG